MADRDVSAQTGQGGLVEDLGHQAEVLVDGDTGAVADRDPGRLLAPVLQRVEAEVGELRDLFAAGPDPEDSAFVLRALLYGVEVVAEPAIASGHLPLLIGLVVDLRFLSLLRTGLSGVRGLTPQSG